MNVCKSAERNEKSLVGFSEFSTFSVNHTCMHIILHSEYTHTYINTDMPCGYSVHLVNNGMHHLIRLSSVPIIPSHCNQMSNYLIFNVQVLCKNYQNCQTFRYTYLVS